MCRVCLAMKLVGVLVTGNVLLFLSLPCCSDTRELVFVILFLYQLHHVVATVFANFLFQIVISPVMLLDDVMN